MRNVDLIVIAPTVAYVLLLAFAVGGARALGRRSQTQRLDAASAQECKSASERGDHQWERAGKRRNHWRVQRGPGDDLHVIAVATKQASIQNGMIHGNRSQRVEKVAYESGAVGGEME